MFGRRKSMSTALRWAILAFYGVGILMAAFAMLTGPAYPASVPPSINATIWDTILDVLVACLAAWCIVDIARRRAPIVGKVFLAVGIILVSTVSIGLTHSWYSPACCSGKDCAPIARATITATNEGYRITLGTADHPMVAGDPVDEIVPYDRVLPSEDGEFHACVRPPVPLAMSTYARIICLYAPQGAEGA